MNAPPLFPRQLYQAEITIAGRIAAMQAIPLADPPPDSSQIARSVVDRLAITLSEQQEEDEQQAGVDVGDHRPVVERNHRPGREGRRQ